MKARALQNSLLLVNVILACQILDITYKIDKVKITISTFSNEIDNIPAAKNNTGASKDLPNVDLPVVHILAAFLPQTS